MSSLPRNIPSFTESSYRESGGAWAASNRAHRGSGENWKPKSMMNGATSAIFGDRSTDLPLFKDKPYYHTRGAARRRQMWRRKRVGVGLVLIVILLWYLGLFSSSTEAPHSKISGGSSTWVNWRKTPSKKADIVWLERRELVRDAFVKSWEAYEKYAWGFDQFHPESKKGEQMIPKGLGWIIVDALDTMHIMNLTKPLAHAREWVTNSLDFDQDHDVNTFETTIRMLGGLLSAHYLANTLPLAADGAISINAKEDADLYLNKASDLADRLLGAYKSPTGIPWASINLKTMEGIQSHADGGASSTAEATTTQLEMKYMANLTGVKEYWESSEKAMKVIDDLGAEDGLVPIFVYASHAAFRGNEIRLGSRGDSYYEYLLKQYLQTEGKEKIYKDMYEDAVDGIRKNLLGKSHPNGLTYVAELPQGIGAPQSPKMDHLVCFLPGLLALGATDGHTEDQARELVTWGKRNKDDMELAKELMHSCYEMYNVTKTGLAPEIAYFNDKEGDYRDEEGNLPKGYEKDIIIHSLDTHNLQRPETVESLFVMWRITGDETYREWGWNIFKAFVEHTMLDGDRGFTSIGNVQEIPPPSRDNMESFWLAETLKYLYLLFGPNDILPLDQVVFNTEAHPFPKFNMERFSTNWTRKPRKDGKLVS